VTATIPGGDVSRDRILRDLTALVAVPSVTGGERPAQDLVASMLAGAGLAVERVETDPAELADDPAFPGTEVPHTELPVVAGRLRTGRPGPTLLLAGHVDVVPPGEPSSWSSPPFEPRVEGGLLYGRGTCDMKGGLVAAIEAVRAVSGVVDRLRGEVVVLSVPAEEDGGAGSLAAIRAGYTADMAVITEPTRLEIVVAHAGAITFTLDVPGRAAHAATRREGVSALDPLAVLLAALAEDETRRNAAETHPLMAALGLPYPTIIGQIEGGSWASTVMDSVRAHGRYGVRLGQDASEAAGDLRRAVARAWEADPFLAGHELGLEIWGARFDSCQVPMDHPLPVSLRAAGERVSGTAPPLVGAPYGADMRLFVNVGDTPTVMFGPGDVRVAHAADEYVAIDDVERCAATLATWMVDRLGA
jgi:acetylornithine deacetylase